LSFPSDIAFTRHGGDSQILISNFAAFATSAGAPGVLKMSIESEDEG
jgi:hypothetical protein